MPKIETRYFYVGGVVLALSMFLFLVPSKGYSVFMSPDETAVAVSARKFGSDWSFRLTDGTLDAWPWAHPRSWVGQQGSMVPVGFLGLPMLAGVIWRLFGEAGMLLLTPFLAIVAAFPVYRLLKGLGRTAQLSGVAVWLSFPTVILYANRGLFPNLALVSLMLWSAYLVWSGPGKTRWLASGCLFGMALAIRPVELPWMAVWMVFAWLAGRKAGQGRFPGWPQTGAFLLGAAVIPVLAAVAAWQTYGSPLAIGYWLGDSASSAAPPVGGALPETRRLWPFGFHPRNVWFNLKNYVFGLLAPWTVVTLGAAALWLRSKGSRLPILAGALTLAILCLVYGQAIYQDHVGHNVVSSGNSFLRYLLPLAPFAAAGAACLVALVQRAVSPYKAKIFAVAMIGGLAVTGIWYAAVRDDEGLRAAIVELERYGQIRQAVFEGYGGSAIVLSPRSDKVFFPLMRAVSPLPGQAEVLDLVRNHQGPVLYFDTVIADKEFDRWWDRGLALIAVMRFQNQALYEVRATDDDNLNAELWGME